MQPTATPLLGQNGNDPADELAAAVLNVRLAGWWDRAGLAEHWPITTEEAAQLFELAGQYAVDAAGLRDLIDRRLLPSPGVGEGGELEWSATDISQASWVVESRGQQRATPSAHDPKKHPCQVLLDLARQAGQVQDITRPDNGPCYDAKHLLALIERCDAREGRAKLIPWLKAVLEVEYGVFVP